MKAGSAKLTESVLTRRICHQIGIVDIESPIARLLWQCVGRIALKQTDGPVRFVGQLDRQELRHIADWLMAAIKDEAPWLSRLDDQGRVKKLLKFGTIAAITAEADKAMIRKSLGMRRELSEGAETVFMELENGYRLVRLHTPEALDSESAEMQHCIGQGAYDNGLRDPDRYFLSLRDGAGKAHVTIDIEHGRMEQMSGKQNAMPQMKYIEALKPFFYDTKFSLGTYENGDENIIIDAKGDAHSVASLPAEFEARGSISLGRGHVWGHKLPKVIKSPSEVGIYVEEQEEAPIRIEAGSKITLHGAGFTTCPEIVPNGPLALELSECVFDRLGSGLVLTNLDVFCVPLAELPEDLVCTESITLDNVAIKSLPAGMWTDIGGVATFSGSLSVEDSPLSDLGGLQHVVGDLALFNLPLEAIPEDLRVDGSLNISGTKVSRIPSTIKIGGGLKASRCTLDFEADDFSVGGYLTVEQSTVRLPRAVSCRTMTANAANIERMADVIVCEGQVDFTDAVVSRLPSVIKTRSLYLWGVAISDIDSDITVEELAVDDRPIRIGAEVKAGKVLIKNAAGAIASMAMPAAREYLANQTLYGGIDHDKTAEKFDFEFFETSHPRNSGQGGLNIPDFDCGEIDYISWFLGAEHDLPTGGV